MVVHQAGEYSTLLHECVEENEQNHREVANDSRPEKFKAMGRAIYRLDSLPPDGMVGMSRCYSLAATVANCQTDCRGMLIAKHHPIECKNGNRGVQDSSKYKLF